MGHETGNDGAPRRPPVGTKRLHCSGYWLVSGNKKRSHDHYAALLPATLDMIQGQELVFHSNDDAQIEHVRRLSEERAIAFTGVHLLIADLPARRLAESMMEACCRMELDKLAKPPSLGTEKGLVHYWRDLIGSGKAVYCDILTIWLSKVFLTAALAQSGRPARPTAWMDVSVSRFNRRRTNWNFRRLTFPTDRLSHYGNDMQYYGAQLPLNASFMCATGPIWAAVEAEYSDSAARAATMAYGHDEETVLADCVWRRPELFHCLGWPQHRSPVRRLLRSIQGAHS